MLSYLLLFSFDSVGQSTEKSNADRVGEYSLPNTQIHYISSEANDVDYKLYIAYPENYDQNASQRYPVLYLLDADYSFAIAKNIVDHLTQRNHLPEILLVGIAYAGPNQYRLHRTRDYTPTHSDHPGIYQEIHQQYSGGGPEFLVFIHSELIPYVNNHFRTSNFRVLSGHSYGGLFTSWTLLTQPTLFQGYIAVSPSLWYDDHFMFRVEEELSSYEGETIKAYFSVGDREINQRWNMPNDLNRFTEILKHMPPDHLEIRKDLGNNETHNSIFPTALSNGLRYVFDGI